MDLDVPQDRLVQPSQLWSANSQLVAGGVPLVLRLVPRHPPNGPWDLAGSGAGSAELWGTRGKSSGELADLNGPAAPGESTLSTSRHEIGGPAQPQQAEPGSKSE